VYWGNVKRESGASRQEPRCEPPVSLVLRVTALVFVFPLGEGKPGAFDLSPLGLLSFLFFLLGMSDI